MCEDESFLGYSAVLSRDVDRRFRDAYSEISHFHGAMCEDESFLGYSAVLSRDVDRRFRDAYYHHHHPDDGIIAHRNVVWLQLDYAAL
jgi:hypothetical protein